MKSINTNNIAFPSTAYGSEREIGGFREPRNKGFTLIEVLVSSAILVILGAGFLGMQYIFSQNQVTAWRNYANIEDSNRIVSKFVKELRDARQSDEGSYPLVATGDKEIMFYSDIDYDGDIERVRYTLSANQLVKGVIEPSGDPISYPEGTETETVLTENVVSSIEPNFYYYNEDWPTDIVNNPLAEVDRIADTKVVKIILTINIRPDDPGSEFTLESSGQIRMLKEN
jgi:prepilin-type N-terminal cleavage/methylation domain-containing protein